jgi:hypothetical protein
MNFRSVKSDPPAHGQRVLAYFQGSSGNWFAVHCKALHNDAGPVFEDASGFEYSFDDFELWIPVPMPDAESIDLAKELAEYKALIKNCDRCGIKECAEFVYAGKDGLEYCQTCYDDMFPREWLKCK